MLLFLRVLKYTRSRFQRVRLQRAPADNEQIVYYRVCTLSVEFFTIRLHLHFKPEFTSRRLKNFKKLPPVGFELATLAITGSKVGCLSK